MGLTQYMLDFFAHVVKDHGIAGSALTLGRIDMYFGVEDLQLCARTHGFTSTTKLDAVRVRGDLLTLSPEFRPRGFVSDHAAFAAFGFDSVDSVDASPFEGANNLFDLNESGLREALGRDFDFVIEAGTMEHVFHIPNFLRNMQSVVKVGGCALHISPTNNSVDHGFYQFSPTLFQDYYTANGWDILEIRFMRYESFASKTYFHNPPSYLKYSPGSLESISQGGLDDKMYGTVVVARRTSGATIGVTPIQGAYRAAWAKSEAGPAP